MAVSDGAYTVAAVPAGDLKTRYMRQLVDDPTGQPAGAVVVDPKNRFLYLVQEGGKALRYGVGVGKATARARPSQEISADAVRPLRIAR